MIAALKNHPGTQKKQNKRGQMGKNNDKWKPYSSADNMEHKWQSGSSRLSVLFSSDHVVYLAMAPASAAPSNFSSVLSLRQIGRSQIICGLVSHFKAKQQLRSQLFPCDMFRPGNWRQNRIMTYSMFVPWSCWQHICRQRFCCCLSEHTFNLHKMFYSSRY